jgi:hypothetical protein
MSGFLIKRNKLRKIENKRVSEIESNMCVRQRRKAEKWKVYFSLIYAHIDFKLESKNGMEEEGRKIAFECKTFC